jgi:hypothetical protein
VVAVKVHLVDGSFFPRERSATLAGQRSGEGPFSFEWVEGPGEPVTFYTDMCLEQAVGQPGRKVAWLLEPPWKGEHYRQAAELIDVFDYVLTYWAWESAPRFGKKALFYPLGGSWIKLNEWGVSFNKAELVSLMVSDKHESEGHTLRHQIANQLPIAHHTYGRGTREIDSKTEALRPYHYSIVVESWRGDWYFSEKLIDCLSQGTIPIYWGCPDIGRFFDTDGILSFETLDELDYIYHHVISANDYLERYQAIRENLELAWAHYCAEDWIFRHYPYLFDGICFRMY